MGDVPEAAAVWAVNHLRHVHGNPLWWPAIRCQPDDIPGLVPPPVTNRVLVKFTGPSCSKDKEFDCYWVTAVEVVDFEAFREQFKAQATGEHEAHLAIAIQEAADHAQTQSGFEDEHASLENDLQFIVNNIPNANLSGFRVYADERSRALLVSGVSIGDPELLENVLREEYNSLPPLQRREHEQVGKQEYQAVMQKARNIVQLRGKRYLDLCERLSAPPHPLLLPLIRLLMVPEAPTHDAAARGTLPGQSTASLKRQPGDAQDGLGRMHVGGHRGAAPAHAHAAPPGQPPHKLQRVAAADGAGPGDALVRPPDDFSLRITCNGYEALLFPATAKVLHKNREFTAPQFEQFCGAGSTKKWKISFRIIPGTVPECPPGDRPMLVGKWLDIKGFASANLRSKNRPPQRSFAAAPARHPQ